MCKDFVLTICLLEEILPEKLNFTVSVSQWTESFDWRKALRLANDFHVNL